MNTNYPAATMAGRIETRHTKKGIEFHAWNHERQRLLHIGTISGTVYEKGNTCILRKPEPSITLSETEFPAAIEAGAQYLRCVTMQKETFSISLANFKQHSEHYYSPSYGPQWRCPLSAFSRTAKAAPRTAITDNPKGGGTSREFHRPEPEQLPLFQPRPHFDEFGSYRG